MNSNPIPAFVAEDCKNLRQGDVIELDMIYLESEKGQVKGLATPLGVAIISQTCDIVQRSKKRLLIAPIINNADKSMLIAARKGRKPLHLYIRNQCAQGHELIADLELTTSIPKYRIIGAKILARAVSENNMMEVAQFAGRISRVYSRHPFPDEIPLVFSKFRNKIQSRADGKGNFSKVLSYVDAIRVAYDKDEKDYFLTITLIIDESYLAPVEHGLEASSPRIEKNKEKEIHRAQSLDQICALLLMNLETDPADLVVTELWPLCCDRIFHDLIKPKLGTDVYDAEIIAKSNTEFNYRDYVESVSLDLEVLPLKPLPKATMG